MDTSYLLPAAFERAAKRLYSLRHARNETQESVAKATGISNTLLNSIERGSYENLSFILLQRLAFYYKMNVFELLAP